MSIPKVLRTLKTNFEEADGLGICSCNIFLKFQAKSIGVSGDTHADYLSEKDPVFDQAALPLELMLAEVLLGPI